MTAIEYLKAKNKMTDECGIDCVKCPLSYANNGERCDCSILERKHSEKAIEIVETWKKEHPVKTRQSEFLKLFPNSDTDRNGNINICPKNIYCQYNCSNYDCCDKCRAEFWSEEIE